MDLGKTTLSFGAVGSIVSTTRLHGDLSIDEKTQWIADSYGEDARSIVCSLARELNIPTDRAFELAKYGDPSFRKACEKHLASLRAEAKRERQEAARRREREEWNRQGARLHEDVGGVLTLIEQLQARRSLVLMHVRAGGLPAGVDRDAEVARVSAEFDDELAKLQARLDEAIAARDAWNAADAERRAAETKKGRH